MKKNIRQFSGYTFSADSNEKKKKVDRVAKYEYLITLSSNIVLKLNTMHTWAWSPKKNIGDKQMFTYLMPSTFQLPNLLPKGLVLVLGISCCSLVSFHTDKFGIE